MRYKILLKRLATLAPLWLIFLQVFLVVYCMVGTVTLYFDRYRNADILQRWDYLPPLPDGETAKEITEIYVNREIHVTTDQDHYYGCTYLEEKNCWFPIPREINHYASHQPWLFDLSYPQVPTGTRQLVVERFDRHEDSGDITFAAIILANGQVAFWDDNEYSDIPLIKDGGWCRGLLFIILAIGILKLIIWLGTMQRES